MSSAEETPVLVGVGQVLQRLEDPREALEPLAMMIEALAQAGTDAGAPELLKRANAIYVLRGAMPYGDPGREIAKRLGAQIDETVGTPYGGNFPQSCVFDAACAIASGKNGIALITGAENGRTAGLAQRQGVEIHHTDLPGEPDRMVAEDKPIFHEAELARGFNSAGDVFAVIESAVRFAEGESLTANEERISKLWADFNLAAQQNPHAWMRQAFTAEEIGTAAADNPMISYPYTRLMNANARVDMAAGLIVCSLQTARSAGVPDEQVVYIHAATEANDPLFASTRHELHRSPGMRLAGGRALELAGKQASEINHFDLYSCFPSAVKVAATELGIPKDKRLTVTGGLTFGGGPLNSYGLHAIARMVEVLRKAPDSMGLVSGNGGWLAKHSFGIYSTRAPSQGFQYEDLQEQVDTYPVREALVDFTGPITIEAYTVAHRGGNPVVAHVACLTPEGKRTWGRVEDPAFMEAMKREEFCGRRGHIDGKGNLSIEAD